MYCTKQVTEDLTWVGADDRRLAMFEGVYSVPRGVSYNAYLLADEATVLFDTVDKAVSRVFFENVAHALNGRKLDYVVVHHMEPDHSATLEELLLRWPEATIVCSAMAAAMIRQFFGDENFPVRVVGEGDTLRTGRHELRFAMTPMVHWPEVMVTFDTADRTLFTADAFGCFGALNGALFADEVDFARDYLDEARRYYCNIVGKYGAQVQVLLQKAAALAPARLCPLHGFVWRKDLGYYLDKYQAWSSYIPEEAGVLIVYASIYGNTENAANILACRLRDRGVQTALYDVSVTPASEILAAAFRYSHLVFASATYNAGVFLSMDALLRDLAAHNLQNRTVALIQNGSWAPASGSQMQKLLAGCKNMTFLEKTVTVKSSVQAVQNAELDALAEELSAALPAASAAAPVPAGPVDAAAVRALTYGLFVLTARDGGRDNGCIVNTAQQITTAPVRLTLAVNKRNYTHDLIRRTGLFNLSVLTQDAPFSVFEQFGFSSGRDTDKFARSPALPRTANGLVYLPEHANAVLSARVTAVQDCGTHTLFVAEVTEARVLSQAPSATYAYYLERIKPKPEDKKPAPGHKVWVCAICGYVYDEAKEGVPFEELPADWTCPWCKHPKSDFRQKG